MSNLPWVFWVCLVSCLALGQPIQASECDDLDGEARTVCLTLVVCTSIDDKRSRNQCLEVARQLLDKLESPEQKEADVEAADRTTTSKDQSAPSAVILDEPISESETTLESTPATSVVEESGSESVVEDNFGEDEEQKRRFLFFFERDLKRREEHGISETVFDAIHNVDPESFSSIVVGVRFSDRNEAIVVLKNGIVFNVQRARQSRFEVGDVVVASKRKGFGSRRSYNLFGKAASVEALRVSCEHIDPTRETVQRCVYASSKVEG